MEGRRCLICEYLEPEEWSERDCEPGESEEEWDRHTSDFGFPITGSCD